MPDTEQRLKQIQKKQDEAEGKLQKVNEKVIRHDIGLDHVNRDVKEIKSDTSFIKRTITGALITAATAGIAGLVFHMIELYVEGGF